MKKRNLLLSIFIGLSIFACSSDDESPIDDKPSYIGTYSLSSIESNRPLDPDVSGTFEDTDLLDNTNCSSLLLMNEDNSFSWDFLSLSQIVNNIMGVTTYTEIECFTFSGGMGQYQVNGSGVSFVFDSSISDTNAILNESSITVTINEELAVETAGEIRLQNVQLTLTYDKL